MKTKNKSDRLNHLRGLLLKFHLPSSERLGGAVFQTYCSLIAPVRKSTKFDLNVQLSILNWPMVSFLRVQKRGKFKIEERKLNLILLMGDSI